jgi:hypothetical protein
MNPAVIAIGVIGAVIFLVLVSSTGMRAHGTRGSQGQWSGNQGPQQWGPNQGSQQRPDTRGGPSGVYGGGGLMQLFAILGVLAVAGTCLVIFLALQSGVQ